MAARWDLMGSEIIISGQRFDIGHPVVTFEDARGYSAYLQHRSDDPRQIYPEFPAPGMAGQALRYRARRLLGKERALTALRQVVRQVVVHLDGCRDARMCFDVLHNQHGLSVHFMVDNDGTIYQTLDLVECAFHAAGVNEVSIGIELQNRGDAARFPGFYKEPRDIVTCRVHDQLFLAYDFTAAQYQGMIALSRALARLLQVPLTSPRSSSQELIWTTLDTPRRFEGFLGHYHITKEKWDPGPWDFQRLFRSIGSRTTFPMTAVRGGLSVPKKKLAEVAEPYYESSEQVATAHFPVGPLGESRLWHGGVHLPADEGSPVYAPITGTLVAARLSDACAVGSCNFALLRHRLDAGARSWVFYSLYYHLRPEVLEPGRSVPWVDRSSRALPILQQGRVALLNELVEAGEPLGHVGLAGPDEARSAQIHFAIFAEEELGEALDPGFWEVIEGTPSSRFCRNKPILDRIDQPFAGEPRDGLLSRREIRQFFSSNPRREELRKVAIRYRSEWTPGDWETELSTAPEFAELPAEERRRLIKDQVEPTLWWTRAVAEHAGLPANGFVYAYHPITFVLWYNEVVEREAAQRAAGIAIAEPGQGDYSASARFKLDAESTLAMTDEEDLKGGETIQRLQLEDLIRGYPE